MTVKRYTLNKSEIIRGFRSFEMILHNSKNLEYDDITAYMNIIQGPSVPPVKVGFPVSKKKLKNLTAEIE